MTLVRGINVEVTGDGPDTVVLLHGFSDNLTTWRRVVPALAVRHRVVAIDLPGHGGTTRPWTTPLMPGYISAIDTVLDSLGSDEPVSIVGNSMGASTAAMYAGARPDRVARLALIGMPGYRGIPLLWRAVTTRPAMAMFRLALAPIPQRHIQYGMGWAYARAASPRPGEIDRDAVRGYNSYFAERWQMRRLGDLGRVLIGELTHAGLQGIVGGLGIPVLQIWSARRARPAPRHEPGRDPRGARWVRALPPARCPRSAP